MIRPASTSPVPREIPSAGAVPREIPGAGSVPRKAAEAHTPRPRVAAARLLWPVAAIAAAILGLWLGGRFLRPADEGAQPGGGPAAGDLVGDATPAVPELRALPVAAGAAGAGGTAGAGLRRLRQGEPHLADSAEAIGLAPLEPGAVSPASLERVHRNR